MLIENSFSYMRILLTLLLLFFIAGNITAQESVILEEDTSLISSLKKGRFMMGIGGNLNSHVRKNEDDYIYYTLDEKLTFMNVKAYFGYFYKDHKAAGLGFRYSRDFIRTKYVTTLGDTVNYAERYNAYESSLFQKKLTPVFGSKRVYMVTMPELSYRIGISNRNRVDYVGETNTRVEAHTISAGIHIGFMVFPASGLSLEAKVGPLGVGYTWEGFVEDKVKHTNAQNYFVNLSPKFYMFSFVFTSYF